MADQAQLDILKQGVEAWNSWRERNSSIKPDLSDANLREAYLSGANLSRANLSWADLSEADLGWAYLREAYLSRANLSDVDLSGADLSDADLYVAQLPRANLSGANLLRANLFAANFTDDDAEFCGPHNPRANLFAWYRFYRVASDDADLYRGADLSKADLSGANLVKANLYQADLRGAYLGGANLFEANLIRANLQAADLHGASLSEADLSLADLTGASLTQSTLVKTNLELATITDCKIYGISAWSLRLEGAKQWNLDVSDKSKDEPAVRVDDLEVAQFIYLLLNNKKLRNVLNAITERGVLILGRFSGGGLEVLQAIAKKLRESEYLPIIFDFDRPADRNYTETVKTLVGLSRFVIVDLSGPSVPQELYATVPHFKIPFVPIVEEGRQQYAMAADILEYPWVVRPPVRFADVEHLIRSMPTRVIAPAEDKLKNRQALLAELFNR